ncbi:hypothetical protein AB0G67_48990 [Streptomyces sp. NPDC021056]|uniref:hypothetical protein n=1 Tax=Streptomyces sp. NPDC021056 TaxID=3155012 RepID=UPI0033D6A684
MISWCPEGTKIKLRMVHSSSYSTLRNLLDSVQVCVQATDLSDLDYDELVSRASRPSRAGEAASSADSRSRPSVRG